MLQVSVVSRGSDELCLVRDLFTVSSPDCRHLDKENFLKGRYHPACNRVNIFCKPDSSANIMVGWDSIAVMAHLG